MSDTADTRSNAERKVRSFPKTLRELAEDERVDDETLIDMAATASNRQIALGAEIALRMRYPSKRAASRLERKEPLK